MTTTQTNISLPTEQVERLASDAKAMGLDLTAYIAFLERCAKQGHDDAFRDATKYAFSKFPETLRTLAQ